jgi:hypothetical protein
MTQIAREVDERMQELEPAEAAALEKTIRGVLGSPKGAPKAVSAKRVRFMDMPPVDLQLKPGIDPTNLEQLSWDY